MAAVDASAPSLLRISSDYSSPQTSYPQAPPPLQTKHQHANADTLPNNDTLLRTVSASRTAPAPPAHEDVAQRNGPAAAVPRPTLLRAQSDYTALPRSKTPPSEESRIVDSEGWHMRHGFDYQNSADYAHELTQNFYLYFSEKRHETAGVPADENIGHCSEQWRMRERLKTVSAAMLLCLNIGVDPPDVMRTNPSAKLECWVDPQPQTASANAPVQLIAKNLQLQYEQLSMRTRYKVLGDPTLEDTKKCAASLRRNAKDERVLFHYNGHGVPKPTASGEIWVFNRQYTQYIPLSIYDLQTWLGAPALLVYDCSDAGLIIENFNSALQRHQQETADALKQNPAAQVQHFPECIQLAATGPKETLPINPNLPADVFTSCLTTPIEMAVRFFILRNPLPGNLKPEDANRIPGRPQERRTPMGELNWIFTAITDTIAWNTLPKPLFKKLFRQDLMVAALFRNYLLAQRIMRVYDCHPMCSPPIASCHDHPLWASWDLAVEMVLTQLPDLLRAEKSEVEYEYKHSDFFAEQLTAFEVYLGQGAIEQKEPVQLPIVLQVLLSQVHRLRALILLSQFLDLGPWAVKLALGIGIFPYVLKLLQSQAIELKPVMVFIWARILAEDRSCQTDLLKDNGYQYFIGILNPMSAMPIRDVSEHRAMCAFIIGMFCKGFKQGQMVAHTPELVESCLSHISWQETEHPLLRQWACLCLSMLWKDFTEAKWTGIRKMAHRRLCEATWDIVPEVRAATLVALTNLLGIPELTEQVAAIEEEIATRVMIMNNDGSVVVRKELIIFYSAFVGRYINRFLVAAYELLELETSQTRRSEDRNLSSTPSDGSIDDDAEPISQRSVYSSVWRQILVMSVDPDPEVARDGMSLTDYVLTALVQSSLGPHVETLLEEAANLSRQPTPIKQDAASDVSRPPSQPPSSPTRPHIARTDSYFSLGMRRTASVAASLKNLAFGPSVAPETPIDPPSRRSTLNLTRPERLSGSGRARLPADWSRINDEDSTLPSSYAQAKFPLPKHYRARPETERTQLPFKSTFFDWSLEYFREPQMQQNEADEPGSEDYNIRLWRRNRNERILEETQKLKEHAGSSRWDKSCGLLDNKTQPMRMCFHQYDPVLAVSDERDTVRIWDWESSRLVNRFSNGNPVRTKMTGIKFINEDDKALLMTGSSDGVVRLFRDYDSREGNHIVSSFRALTDLQASTHNAGMVFDWLQGRGEILVAGDAKVIRVWNAMSEVCKMVRAHVSDVF